MNSPVEQVRSWLEKVVIGLNLCPFAAEPYRNGQVRIAVSQAATASALIGDLRQELQQMSTTPASELETTLVVVTGLLADFEDYNRFLDETDLLLREAGWGGQFQIASFHPQYRFEGTAVDDASNLTNRSPWPILHILREDSVDDALSDYADPESIPLRNIQKMESLSAAEIDELFR